MSMPFRWKNACAPYGVGRALAAVLMSAGLCGMHNSAAAEPTELAYIGSQGNQIRALRLDTATGKLALIGPVAEGLRPTWVLAHPQLPVLYAVNDENGKEGSVSAFAVDRASGALRKLNEVSSGGNGATYLSLDLASQTLLAANFSSGSASSIAVKADGSLGALVSTIKETGSGPHKRQTSAHAHGVVVDPSGRYALVSDLGADRVFVYGFDRATHALSDDAAAARSFVAAPGSGPRHVAFGASGRYVYLLNELTAEITTLAWDAQQGRLAQVQTLQTSSPEFTGVKSGAELAVSRDERFVYVANRGENTLVTYRVNAESGELVLAGRISSGGETPWGFAIDATGRWLLVAHQRGGKVSLFSIDAASGALADTGQSVEMPAPVSVTFVP